MNPLRTIHRGQVVERIGLHLAIDGVVVGHITDYDASTGVITWMRVTLLKKTPMLSTEDGNLCLVEYIRNESGEYIIVNIAGSIRRTLIKPAELTTA